MKVKNGMASNVSFDITPQNRSGSALSSGQERLIESDSGASSTPMMKNSRPLAASEKATGYPKSRNTISDANMIGARFSAMNSIMDGSPETRHRQAAHGSAHRVSGLPCFRS
ncbi:hypothetical protein D9M68_342770 [compost metagenome]